MDSKHIVAAFALAVFCCLVSSAPTVALDDERLWLPSTYRGHYLKLWEAALAAEALAKCEEVLRGTLDLDHGTEAAPVYRILCRRPDGVTYSELVDGTTMEPHSKVIDQQIQAREAEEEAERLAREEAERKAAAEEAERLAAQKAREEAEAARLAEAKAAEERVRRREAFWEICRAEIHSRTAMMMNLEWVYENPRPEQMPDETLRYYAEFNAEDVWGKPLRYKAICRISSPQAVTVELTAR